MMDIREFCDAAESYADLGWAVTEQLRNLLDRDFEYGSLNENAVAMISHLADTLDSHFGIDVYDLRTAIDEYEHLEPEEFDEDFLAEDMEEEFSYLGA